MTNLATGERLFVPGTPLADGKFPGVNRRRVTEDGMRIEYDVPVPMRDGLEILVDIFRPDTDDAVPAIVAWSPYGKHAPIGYDFLKGSGVAPGTLSRHCALEGPDPAMYCPAGFAIVNVDPRGTWGVDGDHIMLDPAEGADEYDLIEWLAEQSWCSGKVGLAGVSYLAISQWFAAPLRPPHLAAINPWEGLSDLYLERCFHGGIPETKHVEFVQLLASRSLNRVEDLVGMRDTHPLYDEYWAGKRANLADIDVPAYVVASWSDHGLHTRGTIEGFKQIASTQKYLEIHGRKKWHYYYLPESVQRQLAFFSRYLKDEQNEVADWPTVRYEVRDRYYVGDFRTAEAWPIPGTELTELHLDASSGSLSRQAPSTPSTAVYDAATGSVEFDIRFEERTEIVGNAALTLWVEARGSDDLDLFVALEKIDASGERVTFPYYSKFEDGSVALGWLRASHRALDEQRSTPDQPWHTHTHEELLSEGEIVPVEIEILPSGTVFDAGDTLRLIVQGHDVRQYENHASLQHDRTRNAGQHVIHTGGARDSFLLVPVLRPDERADTGAIGSIDG
jgi:predicted acyl esterase